MENSVEGVEEMEKKIKGISQLLDEADSPGALKRARMKAVSLEESLLTDARLMGSMVKMMRATTVSSPSSHGRARSHDESSFGGGSTLEVLDAYSTPRTRHQAARNGNRNGSAGPRLENTSPGSNRKSTQRKFALSNGDADMHFESPRRPRSASNGAQIGRGSRPRDTLHFDYFDDEDSQYGEDSFLQQSFHAVKDPEMNGLLEMLKEKVKFLDSEATKEKIELERRMEGIIQQLGNRIALLEHKYERAVNELNEDSSAKKRAGGMASEDELDPELEKRLAYLEKVAVRLENQGSIVQSLADIVQDSMREIGHTVQSQSLQQGKFGGGSADSGLGFSEEQLDAIENIVANATGSLEKELRETLKRGMMEMDNGRKVDNTRLDHQVQDVLARVDLLENKVSDDHEHSLQVLEMLVEEQDKARKSNSRPPSPSNKQQRYHHHQQQAGAASALLSQSHSFEQGQHGYHQARAQSPAQNRNLLQRRQSNAQQLRISPSTHSRPTSLQQGRQSNAQQLRISPSTHSRPTSGRKQGG